MKKKNTNKKIFDDLKSIQVALFKSAEDPEKRELLRKLELHADLREHISDVIKAMREMNKVRTGDSS